MLKSNIFREYDIRGVADTELLDAGVEQLGRAFGTYLQRHAGKKINLGRDTRLSSPRLRDALREWLLKRAILAELRGLTMRVMGAPIQTQMFGAIGAKPSVIAYNEVYNAIQPGVIQGAENEAAGLAAMKFYEVGPNISQTQHAITVRPICFSAKTYRKLPPDLQTAILKAGLEAGKLGRQIESSEDAALLARLEKEGKLKLWTFTERPKLLELAEPVKQAYAKEIEATAILNKVNAIK